VVCTTSRNAISCNGNKSHIGVKWLDEHFKKGGRVMKASLVSVATSVVILVVSSSAFAVITGVGDAPERQPSATTPSVPGVIPPMQTDIDKNGECVATTDANSPSDYNSAEIAAHASCLNTLIPKRPVPFLQTPGNFFVGYIWGKKSSQVVYGPQIGFGAAILFPLHRPNLLLKTISAGPAGPIPPGSHFTFKLPDSMTWTTAIAVSFDANLAAFTFPNASTADTASGKTQSAFNAGLAIAPQFGWEWWDGGAKSVMVSMGVLLGYVNTDATGAGFTIGVQPGIVAQF